MVPEHTTDDDLPVTNITWSQAAEYCDRLSNATHRAYRLPKEEEWEVAATGKTQTGEVPQGMLDGVGEWCDDRYRPLYDSAVTTNDRVIRGLKADRRAQRRARGDPKKGYPDVGFRILLVLP
jgi:formylglycine-generating enzyme required for sulfatase activity